MKKQKRKCISVCLWWCFKCGLFIKRCRFCRRCRFCPLPREQMKSQFWGLQMEILKSMTATNTRKTENDNNRLLRHAWTAVGRCPFISYRCLALCYKPRNCCIKTRYTTEACRSHLGACSFWRSQSRYAPSFPIFHSFFAIFHPEQNCECTAKFALAAVLGFIHGVKGSPASLGSFAHPRCWPPSGGFSMRLSGIGVIIMSRWLYASANEYSHSSGSGCCRPRSLCRRHQQQ